MQIILFDDNTRFNLLPFTHTRPIADIRCGIYTMRERWEYFLKSSTSTLTLPYLQTVFPISLGSDNLLINGSLFANENLVAAVINLPLGHRLVSNGKTIAARTENNQLDFNNLVAETTSLKEIPFQDDFTTLNNTWDIFSLNDKAIREDFKLITNNKRSEALPKGLLSGNPDKIFVEEGANIYAGCIINAGTGPVYIGKHAEILEGTMIRGPLAICDHAVVKMGAKLYGATTIGPGSKVGGEINNVVFFANSNKAHDGYLGNAVIGEWCNLGADTNCSNLKNNYDEVKIWDEYSQRSVKTGLTFCGLMMGDHSKCGINTMFNTGTIAGVSCNIFGSGFPSKFIPSFTWGGAEEMTNYDFNKAMETIVRVMTRRHKTLTPAEIEMYRHIFETTASQRELFNSFKA